MYDYQDQEMDELRHQQRQRWIHDEQGTWDSEPIPESWKKYDKQQG